MRRTGQVGAALLVLVLGGGRVPAAHAQTASAVDEAGWWSRQPLAQPMPEDGFAIGWAVEEEQSAAAVRIGAPDRLDGTVYLILHESGGAATDQGLARVCVTEDDWEPANPGPYEDLPQADCAPGETAELGRDAVASTWVADITGLVAAASGDHLSLVVRPVGKAVNANVPATAPFEVRFDAATLRVEAIGTPRPVDTATTPPFAGDPAERTGGGDQAPLSPPLGGSFDAPALVPVPPATRPPSRTTTPTSGGEVALGPVEATSSDGTRWLPIVVLVPISAGIGLLAVVSRRWQLGKVMSRGFG